MKCRTTIPDLTLAFLTAMPVLTSPTCMRWLAAEPRYFARPLCAVA
jgi:hypothetical protein